MPTLRTLTPMLMEESVGMTEDEVSYPGIANRLTAVRKELGKTQKMMSDVLKLGASTWQRLEAGNNAPSGETLLRIAELGFNPGWILTGTGPARLSDQSVGLPNDKNLIARVSVAIADAYKEIGHPLSPARAGEELHTMLTLIVDASESPDEYLDQVPVMAKRLRKRLREAVAAPGTGKASA